MLSIRKSVIIFCCVHVDSMLYHPSGYILHTNRSSFNKRNNTHISYIIYTSKTPNVWSHRLSPFNQPFNPTPLKIVPGGPRPSSKDAKSWWSPHCNAWHWTFPVCGCRPKDLKDLAVSRAPGLAKKKVWEGSYPDLPWLLKKEDANLSHNFPKSSTETTFMHISFEPYIAP